jgi:protein tyrosine/serine phosphatase
VKLSSNRVEVLSSISRSVAKKSKFGGTKAFCQPSSSQIALSTMHLFPPQNFGAVEDGIYRSGLPSELNYRFLESLQLKTVIVLSPESMDGQFASFLEDFRIRVVYIQNATNDSFRGLSPVAEETVIDALNVLTDRSNLVSTQDLSSISFLAYR